MSDEPLFVSPSTVKSLWQEYRIFADRLELDSMFGLISIPFEHIETVDLSDSDVSGLLKGDLGLKNFRPAFKLDWANFMEHVVIDKTEGFFRRVLITPDDPSAFNQELNDALMAFRES